MKILFALAGLHRVHRGAEVAFIAIASELSKLGNDVTLAGSGPATSGRPYRFLHVPALARERFERWPQVPGLRSPEAWEDATFAARLLTRYHPQEFDLTVTCAYPFTQWALRRAVGKGRKPKHVFVTQNGDWPAQSNAAEFRFFNCDGLVCINPDYLERNSPRYRSVLIPNGVDLEKFSPGPGDRSKFGLPGGVPVVLMVSALISSKNVSEGIEAIACVPDAHLVVAGDGPLRDSLQALAEKRLPGRYHQFTVDAAEMPTLYRSANVFMHLSKDESFGNVYVEALATGLPVVAFDSRRTRWILGDQTPLVTDASVDGLSKALRTALKRDKEFSVTNRARAQQFSWQSIGRQYNEFFIDLLKDGPRAIPISGPFSLSEAGR